VGFQALVDDADFDRCSVLCWHRHASGRVRHTLPGNGAITMGRFILDAAKHLRVSYRNGDFLDNRRENLILRTVAGFTRKGGFIGVDKSGKGWSASVLVRDER
jgi:hypothetical protein